MILLSWVVTTNVNWYGFGLFYGLKSEGSLFASEKKADHWSVDKSNHI